MRNCVVLGAASILVPFLFCLVTGLTAGLGGSSTERAVRWTLLLAGTSGIVATLVTAGAVGRLLARQAASLRRAEASAERVGSCQRELQSAASELQAAVDILLGRVRASHGRSDDARSRAADLDAVASSATRVQCRLAALSTELTNSIHALPIRREVSDSGTFPERVKPSVLR